MLNNIPNLLTLGRIIAIPLVLLMFYLPDSWLSLPEKNFCSGMIFVVAAITDWFDGFLARKLKQTSSFGAFLDPVADKLMVAATLIILLQLGRVDAFIATIIIGREITISAVREWMAQLGQTKSVAVSFIGKLKTAAQMTALPMLLYNGKLWGIWDTRFWGDILIYVAAILTLVSMVYYLYQASPFLRWKSDSNTAQTDSVSEVK